MKKNTIAIAVIAVLSSFLVSCRGDKSSSPSVILIQNMVDQTSFGPQSQNKFFKDGSTLRKPISGTVSQEDGQMDVVLETGMEPNSKSDNPVWIKKFPMQLTMKFMNRGMDRFNIYCAPCHGYDGNSDGLVTRASGGTIRPANIHDQQKIQLPVGQIYNVVTNGLNNWNMPGFAEQMNVRDRWAVVAYVRALQLSQKVTKHNVTASPAK